MAKKIINVGTVANDGTGDRLRDAFIKVKENFDELYSDKVDKELGKSLVSDLEIAKLLTVEEGAQKNVPFTGLATEQFVNDGLQLKVDKENGKSLISDLEIVRLQNVVNQTRQSLNVDLVDNTADIDKPISTAQTAGLQLKVDKESGKSLIADSEITRLASVTNQTKASLGLGNVDNTSDANKPISTAQNSVNNAKLDKVTAVDVEKIYVKNADGTQGMRPFTDFISAGGIDPSIQQEISGNITATEAMKNKVLIVTANTTFTISNTILSKDWTVRMVVINGVLDIAKGSTRVFELGNPELNLEKGSDITIRQRASTANLIITGEFLNNPFIAIFETRNTALNTSLANQLTIRTGGTGVVDWGNGDREPLAGILTKTYDKEGAKTIKIYSQSFVFSQVGIYDSNKITEVLNYGGLQIGANIFSGCAYLNMEGAKGIPNLTTSLLNSFANTQRMKKINNLEYADFSTITTLKNAFQNSKINQPMGFLNVSNVTDFSGMMTFKTPADFSTDNYDGILNGWSERKFAVTNHAFTFGSIKHTSASSQSKLLWTRPNIVVPITNAINNGAGLIRVTAIAHGMATGNKVFIADVVGGMGINRAWTVTVIDINTVDLQGSTFATAYVSGGGLRTGWGHVLTDGGI